MARQAPDHRFHHHNAVLQPSVQGCGTASQNRPEEGRHQGPLEHPRQRVRTVRHPLHLRRHQRQLHAEAVELHEGGHTCLRPRLHRLRQVRGTDTERSRLCHQDEEEPRVRHPFRHDVPKRGGADGAQDTTCGVPQAGQGRGRHRPSRPHRHLCGYQERQGKAGLAADQRHGNGGGRHRGDIPQKVGNRASVQAAQAELPAEILLRRECQRHQDTGMGHAYRQPATFGHTKACQKVVELLGAGNNVQDYAHVLCQLLHLP